MKKTKEERKLEAIKNLKVFGKTTKILAPYVLITGLALGTSSALSETPFVCDNQKKVAFIETNIDQLGNVETFKKYDNVLDEVDDSKVSYVGKWEKEKDGFYSRKIKTYKIKKVSKDNVTKLLMDNSDISLDELFGDYTLTEEIKNSLTEEEINRDAHIEIITYDKDKNDYIYVKQTAGENVAMTVIVLSITLLANANVHLFTADKRKKYNNEIAEIKEKYAKEKDKILALKK